MQVLEPKKAVEKGKRNCKALEAADPDTGGYRKISSSSQPRRSSDRQSRRSVWGSPPSPPEPPCLATSHKLTKTAGWKWSFFLTLTFSLLISLYGSRRHGAQPKSEVTERRYPNPHRQNAVYPCMNDFQGTPRLRGKMSKDRNYLKAMSFWPIAAPLGCLADVLGTHGQRPPSLYGLPTSQISKDPLGRLQAALHLPHPLFPKSGKARGTLTPARKKTQPFRACGSGARGSKSWSWPLTHWMFG